MPNNIHIKKLIDNFKIAFLGDGNKKKEKKISASDDTYKNIIENIFHLSYDNNFGLNDVKGTYDSPILDVLDALIEYLHRDRIVKIGSSKISDIDKNKAILLFMIMFTKFTLNQGGAIVTSLEHLLYLFLKQAPGGLEIYDKSQSENKQFKAQGGTYKPNTYQEESNSTGMMETVERKYMKGMDKILDINENSRFINLLAILRRSVERDGDDVSKRCIGAKETLDFGETLTQANSGLCGSKKQEKTENPLHQSYQDLIAIVEPKITGEITLEGINALKKSLENVTTNSTNKEIQTVISFLRESQPVVAEGGSKKKRSKKTRGRKNSRKSNSKRNRNVQKGGEPTNFVEKATPKQVEDKGEVVSTQSLTDQVDKVYGKIMAGQPAVSGFQKAKQIVILEKLLAKVENTITDKTKNESESVKTQTQAKLRQQAVNGLKEKNFQKIANNKSQSVEQDSPLDDDVFKFIARKNLTVTNFFNTFLKPTFENINAIDPGKGFREATILDANISGNTPTQKLDSIDALLNNPTIKPNIQSGGVNWSSTNVTNTYNQYFTNKETETLENPENVQRSLNKCQDMEALYAIKHYEFMEITKPITYFLDTLTKNMLLYIIILNLYGDAETIGQIEFKDPTVAITRAKQFTKDITHFIKTQGKILSRFKEGSNKEGAKNKNSLTKVQEKALQSKPIESTSKNNEPTSLESQQLNNSQKAELPGSVVPEPPPPPEEGESGEGEGNTQTGGSRKKKTKKVRGQKNSNKTLKRKLSKRYKKKGKKY